MSRRSTSTIYRGLSRSSEFLRRTHHPLLRSCRGRSGCARSSDPSSTSTASPETRDTRSVRRCIPSSTCKDIVLTPSLLIRLSGPGMANVYLLDQSLQERPRLLLHHRRPPISTRSKRQHGVLCRSSPPPLPPASHSLPCPLSDPSPTLPNSSPKPSNTTTSSSPLPPTSP